MSFRTRLTSFFVLIVVMPMLAVGILVFRLISDSQRGKAEARLSGVATEVLALYQSSRATAASDAASMAREIATLPLPAMLQRAAALQGSSGFVRVGVRVSGRSVLDRGATNAIAPGTARVQVPGEGLVKVTVSELAADEFARELSARGVVLVIRQRGRLLAATPGVTPPARLPRDGTVEIRGNRFRAIAESLVGYGRSPVVISILSSLAATGGSTVGSQLVALGLIFAFLLLAVAFAIVSSRGLQSQIRSFLHAARRLGRGDFSSPIQIHGRDEFAALGEEFNSMSRQLEARLEELGEERRRLRDSLRRIGQLFASNLDRQALLDLALHTAVDAVEASCGRLTARSEVDEALTEAVRVGSLEGYEDLVIDAEREALRNGALAERRAGPLVVLSVLLSPREAAARAHGVITLARRGEAFSDDDRDLLRSLAAQAAVALANVQHHQHVSRQAVTDQLTGLANHGRFQDLLGTEVEQVRRYAHPLSLVLLDIDNFKSVNDTYGHQQGDLVLEQVARALRDTSRDADVPARYGGEEMALILPHTDLDGAYAIAERARTAIESLRVPLIDGVGELRVTASLGVATMTSGEKDALIAEADAALYEAKRSGKNRCVRAQAPAANAVGAG